LMSYRQEPAVVDYNRTSYDSYGRPVTINSSTGPAYVAPAPTYTTQTVHHDTGYGIHTEPQPQRT